MNGKTEFMRINGCLFEESMVYCRIDETSLSDDEHAIVAIRRQRVVKGPSWR